MGQSVWLRSLSGGAGVVAIAAAVAPTPAASSVQVHRFHYDHVLGTSLDVTAVGGEGAALVAVAAVHAEIARLERIFSVWREDSELSRLNAAPGVATAVSPDLFAVISAAEFWRRRTEGSFDARKGAAADPAADVACDADAGTVLLPVGVTLDLDGIAKGHIVDAAVASARRAAPGLAGLSVDIGGDVRCWGRAPAGGRWRVGVAAAGNMDEAEPSAVLALGDRAVASSGDAARGAHLRHPHLRHSGAGAVPGAPNAATVLAETAADADALATALALLPPARGIAVASGLPGVEALVVAPDGGRWMTDGWSALLEDGSHHALRGSEAAAAWPDGMAFALGYRIPRIAVENYRAPYVAIWVTDESRRMVRTLLLLGDEARWLDSNYVWWRRYGRKTEKLDAMTKPSRQPGTYSLTWDGRDDAGAAVAAGRYLLHVEAAREHGGHTYQTMEFDIGDRPMDIAIPAKDELGDVTVRYGKAP